MRLMMAGGFLMAMATAAVATPIVTDGAAQACIVAPHEHLLLAQELQSYLLQMTGVEVPIGSMQGKVPIRIGGAWDGGDEDYEVTVTDKSILLRGGPTDGTAYAVYTLLNLLGVRWYMPGKFGTVVPTTSTLTIEPVTIRESPDFASRYSMCQIPIECQEDELTWRKHNRLHRVPPHDNCGDGSWAMWIKSTIGLDEAVAASPEKFAKNPDGSINKTMPNLSDRWGPQWYARILVASMDKFGKDDIGFSSDDAQIRDWASASLSQSLHALEPGERPSEAKYSISEEWLRYANDVCKEVRKVKPNAWVGTNGYANRTLPPQLRHGEKLDDHLLIMFAPLWVCTIHAYGDPMCPQAKLAGDLLERWLELAPGRVWLYQYVSAMHETALVPVPRIHQLARAIPYYKKLGINGFQDESRTAWAEETIPSRYIRARMYWDADANPWALLHEFCETWYGPAAKPMEQYHRLMNDAVYGAEVHARGFAALPTIYGPVFGDLRTTLMEAEDKARSEPYATRVRVDRLSMFMLEGFITMMCNGRDGRMDEVKESAEVVWTAQRMLHDISPHFVPYDENDANSGIQWAGIKTLVNRWDGLSVASRRQIARFDRRNSTVALQYGDNPWIEPTRRPAGVQLNVHDPWYMQTDQTQEQTPILWYTLKADIEQVPDTPCELVIPEIYGECWVWLNGDFVGRADRRVVQFPVVPKSGENELVIRADVRYRPEKEGLISVPFIWDKGHRS